MVDKLTIRSALNFYIRYILDLKLLFRRKYINSSASQFEHFLSAVSL